MSADEKRRGRRTRLRLVIEICDAEGWQVAGVGNCLDLSSTGALLESALRMSAGEALRLRLRVPGRTALEVPARVIHARRKPSGSVYGIRFDEPIALPGILPEAA